MKVVLMKLVFDVWILMIFFFFDESGFDELVFYLHLVRGK